MLRFFVSYFSVITFIVQNFYVSLAYVIDISACEGQLPANLNISAGYLISNNNE